MRQDVIISVIIYFSCHVVEYLHIACCCKIVCRQELIQKTDNTESCVEQH